MSATQKPILEIKDLAISFKGEHQVTDAVTDVSFTVNKGETLAIVGESGSGKSISALSILGLLPYPTAFHPKGEIFFEGENILQAPSKKMMKIRGNRISMIFQEPMTSLDPLHTPSRNGNCANR